MSLTASISDDIKSLDMPEALIQLLLKNSLNREQLLRMTADDLACVLNIDIEAAKIIQSSLRKALSNLMMQQMTQLG